jgi:[acyl-carrier-protein] S-malonyltransferase
MTTLAMVFPGQGSQSVGMLEAYGDRREVRDTVAEASEILGQDIARLVAEGPPEELSRTVNTQPIMLTAGVAVYRLWHALGGPAPSVVAGHSLGEYTALVAAGALAFEDALPLVRFRAQAMQDAVPPGIGAMAAIIGADDDAVRGACAEAARGEVVEPVNFNAPGQVVIAGNVGAVERAITCAKARGAKRGVKLPVSAPFHSSLLAPAAARLRDYLESVKVEAPRIPVIHNYDVASHPDPQGVRAALVAQADHPVRWVEAVRAIVERGVRTVYECGPGKVLAPLVQRIAEDAEGVPLNDLAALEDALAALGRARA